jgi:hypothetical protein
MAVTNKTPELPGLKTYYLPYAPLMIEQQIDEKIVATYAINS